MRFSDHLIRVAIACAIATFAMSAVIWHLGWPHDHDFLRPLLRAGEIAGQWRLGHLVPVWSTGTQDGYGSASPILYHKLFTYASALLLLAGASGKAALVVPIAGFMVAGFTGSASAIRVMLARRDLALETVAGLVFLTCNYVTTDWLVRGAVAEFAAIMLLPWLLHWCVALIGTGRARVSLGVIMPLLWLAHSGIALFALVAPAFAIAIAIMRHGRNAASAIARKVASSVVLASLLVAPFALPALSLARAADLQGLIAFETPAKSHQPMMRLFHDAPWGWGDDWTSMSLQVDPLLLATLAGLVPLVLLRARMRPEAAFLLALAATMLSLQHRAALPVFDLPGLAYLQFSWRLLGMMSAALVLALPLLLDAALPAGVRRSAGVALVIVLALAGKPWTARAHTAWFTAGDLAGAVRGTASARAELEPPEYLPPVAASTGIVLRWMEAHFARTGLCIATGLDAMPAERTMLHFSGSCGAAREIAIPVFAAPGVRVTQGGTALAFHRTCDDPRIRTVLTGTGPITVVPPGWWSASLASFRATKPACQP